MSTGLLKCNSSRFFVTEATKENINLLLRRLDEHFTDGKNSGFDLTSVEDWIPDKMRAVEYDTGSIGYLNKTSFVLSYGEWLDIDSEQNDTNLAFQNFQLGLFARNSGIRQLDDITLYFGLMAKYSDSVSRGLVEGTDDAEKSEDLENSGLLKIFDGETRIDVRMHMISDDGSFFDGVEGNWGYTFPRIWDNVFGITVNLALGADNVWGGTSHRNWYYGAGLEFNMHFGKNVIFLEAQSTRHRGPNFDWDESTQVLLGWRVSSIKFGG